MQEDSNIRFKTIGSYIAIQGQPKLHGTLSQETLPPQQSIHARITEIQYRIHRVTVFKNTKCVSQVVFPIFFNLGEIFRS